MAYAALVCLAQTIEKVTLNSGQDSISLQGKQEIISLRKYVNVLQTFLEDFPGKASSLEGRIRDVANEAEDIIEYFQWKQFRSRFRLIKWRVLPGKSKFEHQLRKVREDIDSITGEVMDMKNNSATINDVVQLGDSSAASSSSRPAPKCKINDTVGLDDDLIAIKTRLCGESSKLHVIPIVGMGGIGKSTLARIAYDDPLTMQYFDVRAWVTVSQDYCREEILSRLLVSMKLPDEEICGQSNEPVQLKVYKSLKARRYVIVMDDMWSTEAWDDVRNILPDDGNGSRIMLTTRLLDVASYPDPGSPLYEMHLLDQEKSWNLLQQKVFTNQNCPPELEDIGKMIAGSCKGLPLAIIVVAGLLSTVSMSCTSWLRIAENVNSAVTVERGQFEEILSLSYTHLPHHLRPCFLYLGGFPEGHQVRVSRLIKLWIAEGFLKPPNGFKSFELEAEEYLEDLVKRSLVMVTNRKSNGKIKSCSLHDLVRDLCIRKALEEKFLVNLRVGNVEKFLAMKIRKDQRRVSSESTDLPYLSKIYGTTVHTIMWFHHTSLPFLESFRLLRILNVERAYVRPLPVQLFELFHLRYLAITYPHMIPPAISKLQNLHTLIIHARKAEGWIFIGSRTDRLPQEVWGMPQLRHILFYGMLPEPRETTPILENLQTLSSLAHYMCTEQILTMIPNLKKLEIDCYDYRDDTCLNNLVYLHQLEILKLRSSVFSNAVWRKDNFTFPAKLKKLTLSGLVLPWNEMTVVGSLPNLQVLKIRDFSCIGSTWETTEGEFSQLEFLLIENSNLEHWITESSHFPSLKRLMLRYCGCLGNIPEGIGEISTLELIKVERCNESLVESAKRIQEEQQNWENYALEVRCIVH